MNQLYKRMLVALLAVFLSLTGGVVLAGDVVLGAGDALKISVYANPDLSLETRVSEDGNITYPLIGTVAVDGLSVSDAEKKIADLLRDGGFVKKPQVNIVVTSLESQQISILGQVNKPGRYALEGRRSITEMLATAGGISADGGEVVTIIRSHNGKSAKRTVDIIGMVESGNLATNYDLESNDLIYVERYPRFYIYGEVQRPGVYRLEKSMTLMQALSSGGGLTLRGTERRITIKRRDGNGVLQIIDAKQDDVLQSDDVIFVRESLF